MKSSAISKIYDCVKHGIKSKIKTRALRLISTIKYYSPINVLKLNFDI